MPDAADTEIAMPSLRIQRAKPEHLKHVVDLDARVTGQAKPEFWNDIFERYAKRRVAQRFFLVAEAQDHDGILGLSAGEVRGWEFGSQPCGWIFAVSVDPAVRQRGIGKALFKAMCDEFRQAGVTRVRTMVQRQNPLHMSFFRSEGMKAGPYTQLELSLDDL